MLLPSPIASFDIAHCRSAARRLRQRPLSLACAIRWLSTDLVLNRTATRSVCFRNTKARLANVQNSSEFLVDRVRDLRRTRPASTGAFKCCAGSTDPRVHDFIQMYIGIYTAMLTPRGIRDSNS